MATPPPGAKIIDLVDVVEDNLDLNIDDDSLDALLAELDAPAKAPGQPPQAAAVPTLEVSIDDEPEEGDMANNDLDMLLNQLGGEAPPPQAPAEDAGELAGDDLDNLLSELAEQKPTPQTPASGPAEAASAEEISQDDLDSLLNELATSKGAPAPEEPAAPEADAASDLDDLLNELAAAPPEAPPETAEPAGGTGLLDADDIDSLLKEIAPAPAPAEDLDDLDSLLADLEATPTAPPKPMAITVGAGQELDTLLAELNIDAPTPPGAPAPPKPAPPKPAPAIIPLAEAGNEALGAITQLPTNLDAGTAERIYRATLETVLKEVLPGLVAAEVTRRVEAEIEAIKALAAGSK